MGAARSTLKHPGVRLMPTVRRIRLLAIKPERLKHRDVLDGEEECFSLPRIDVLVPGPWGHHEEIPLVPIEAFPLDHTEALPREDVIDGATRLAVRPGVHLGPKHLDPAADGAQRGAPCG